MRQRNSQFLYLNVKKFQSHNALRRLSFQVATGKLHGTTMGDQIILEEDYNEDYEPTDEGCCAEIPFKVHFYLILVL